VNVIVFKEIINRRNYTATILYERKTSLRYWWRYTDRKTSKYADRNLSTCPIIHHKSHVDSLVSIAFPRGKRPATDRPSEPWLDLVAIPLSLKLISLYKALHLALQMVCNPEVLLTPLQLLAEMYGYMNWIFWKKFSLNYCTVLYLSIMKCNLHKLLKV
jgi:hypothetical protein